MDENNNSNQTKKCQFCGAEIDAEAQKCKFCGEWVDKKNEDDLPQELKHFNWGAFLLNWIWGIMHKKYITLLYFPACLIPVVGPLAISIWFGVMGNRWAWNSQKWESPEQFNEVQERWVRLWIVLAIFALIIAVKMFVVLSVVGSAEV